MAFCFQVPEQSILHFLHESEKLLPTPSFDVDRRELQAPVSGDNLFDYDPPLPADSTLTVKNMSHDCSPSFSLPPTSHTYDAMSALNVISLKCASLVSAEGVQGHLCLGDPRDAISQTESSVMAEVTAKSWCPEGTPEAEVEALAAAPPNPFVCLKKSQRKQEKPVRSVERQDPDFEGVRFQMKLGLDQRNVGEYRLFTTTHYSVKCLKKSRKLRTREICLTPDVSRSSSSEEERDSSFASRSKRCASCKTQTTPLWRVAEDGTPLCNACGIRYRKYKIRCFHCWNIPKKIGKSYSSCSNCGRGPQALMTQCKAGKRKFNSYPKVPGGMVCC